ncbi:MULTISPECIES: oxidoreductase [unclassified Phenylobacterium]|uniref:oxidoreductase n=1 Tax=unclassified Phenylobacterium TaxID=2640670 RepID=UPI002264F26A|nr:MULTISPECIES: oxidoreductase [unclassified Phenylobacterium]MBS0491909.1 SDR family NAD(P)-dependent oxidoreductase [Pseudomonadota bacterium]MCX7585634.1 oxidoreductase [Phenylobacterium sp. 58.2.17]WGU41160.1 oxidoreductase [Phenylobacterium sp. NIBR 498073]
MIRSRFGAFTPARVVAGDHDLSGRNVIVTGGASGIGYETAKALAAAGADVMLAVRDRSAGEKAAVAINEAIGADNVVAGTLDLASLASVGSFVDAWGDQPLDILINNAGVMATPLLRTAEDLELQIGTNHFGHFVLAVGLTRALLNAAEDERTARVVALSSIGHRRSDIHWDDPNYLSRPYDKWEAYGQSKTANSLFAVGYNARFEEHGITANAVMPGGIMTPLQRYLPKEEMVAMGWMDEEGNVREGFKTPEQGASTSVWAAVGEELEGIGGLYLEDCAEAPPWNKDNPMKGVMPYAIDPDAADRLWALSEEITGVTA